MLREVYGIKCTFSNVSHSDTGKSVETALKMAQIVIFEFCSQAVPSSVRRNRKCSEPSYW